MANRTKTTTTRSRGATVPKRSPDAATARTGDRTCTPGRTVGEEMTKSVNPQRTVTTESVENAAAGETSSKPERAQPPAAPVLSTTASKTAPSAPAPVRASSPVSSASPPIIQTKQPPELCKKFMAGRCFHQNCRYTHASDPIPVKQVSIFASADHQSSTTTQTTSNFQPISPKLSGPTGCRRSKFVCQRYIRGQCQDANCRRRHPRQYDAERTESLITIGSEDEPNTSNPVKETRKAPAPSQSSVTMPATVSSHALASDNDRSSALPKSSPSTQPTIGSPIPAVSSDEKSTAVQDLPQVTEACAAPPERDQRVCRLHLKGRCYYSNCRFSHIDPVKVKMRKAAAQSEQQRQQSPAAGAVDSVATGPPRPVPSGGGKLSHTEAGASGQPAVAPLSSPLHVSRHAVFPEPEVEGAAKTVEEPKGIGDPSTTKAAVCQFFQNGQCIAANCKLLHELPQPVSVRSSSSAETPLPANNNKTTTTPPSHAKIGSSRPHETNEPSLFKHLSFSNAIDLGNDEMPLPAGKANHIPSRPFGLPLKPEAPQNSQPVPGWHPDARPARRYYYFCRQYRTGECPRGDDCLFFHTLAIDDRRAMKQSKVCELYLIGACDYGDKCHCMHISPDSPTLPLPTRQSVPAPQGSLVNQAYAGVSDTYIMRAEKRGQATVEQTEKYKAHTPAVVAEQVGQETNARSIEKPGESTNQLDNKADRELVDSDRLSTYTHSTRDRPTAVNHRAVRQSSITCTAYLLGRCRYGDGCFKTHMRPEPEPLRGNLPGETEMHFSTPLSPITVDASAARAPTPTSVQTLICLNWLMRGACLNGASCAYEHSARGLLALAQHATELPENVTPMPISGTNYSRYQPQEAQPNTRSLRDQSLDQHPLYPIPFSPMSPSATSQSGPLGPQGETMDRPLNLIDGPPSRPQTLALDRQSDRTLRMPSSSWREPVLRGAQCIGNTRYDDPSRYCVPGNSNRTASNVGPRLRQSRPDSLDSLENRGIEQAQDTRDAGATDRGEYSSDSSFHSAVDFSDASNNSSPSTSANSTPAKAKLERPLCWDFVNRKCGRSVCYFRHEYPLEQQGVNALPQRKFEADTRSSVNSVSRNADLSRPRTTGAPEEARQEQQLGNVRHPTPATQPVTVPSVPPGLGLEPKLPVLAPPPAIPRNVPPTSITLTVLDSTRVTYGPGFDVQSVVTAFETRQVMLKDLPRGISHRDVSNALKSYGEINSVFLPDPGKKGVAGAKVTFATPEQAANAASALDGTELFGSTISARLWSGQTSLVGKARLVDGDVLFEFPCAHKTGYAGYSTRAQAEKAISLANETEVKGNWITAELHEGLPSAGAVTVRFRGLPASTQMKDLARYGKAEGFMMERPNYESTKIAIHRLRGILEKFGHDFLFNLLPPPYKRGNVRAYAHFETAEAAETVCAALNNRRQPFCGYGLLSATHVSTLVYQLPRPVFDALAYDIRLLNAFVWKTFEPGSGISIIDNRAARGPYSPVCVKLAARRSQALTKMKALFDRLLHGERIEQDGEIVWDTFFARRAGAMYLEDLQKRHAGVLVNWDPRKGILSLFGPEPKRRIVRSAILAKVADLKSRKWYTIDLPGRLIGLFCGWDLATLQLRFGEENVMLDIAARTLRVRGDDAVHEAALLAVKQARERHADEKHQPQVECPVCFTEVTNPVKLDCGHTWCKNCLQNYMRASIDNASFPLVCLGDEASCSARIPIHVAQEVLSTNDFNDILEAAFRAHVHSHPKEYHYCPTPDCKQVYHRNTKCHVLQCPSCLLRICPKCNAEYHEHSPCQGDEASDRALFEEWKQSHDVKDCPGCKAPIERDAGCNHMTCVRCKTHICWVCLATFEESGEVYAHMHSIHGGIGLEEV